jgi:hypothetical protein
MHGALRRRRGRFRVTGEASRGVLKQSRKGSCTVIPASVLDGGSLCESESEKGDCATQVLFWRTWEDEAACLRVHRSLALSHVEPWLGEVDPEETELWHERG